MPDIGTDKRQPLGLEKATVLSNEEIAERVWVIALVAPQTASTCKPGQFVHIRLYNNDAEILRLPFSVYGIIREHGAIEVMYQILGNGTRRLASLTAGDSCDLIGPIGNTWCIPEDARRALLVSGGLGAAPLAMLSEKLVQRNVTCDFAMGAPTSNRLVGRDRLGRYGTVMVATDDGSEGVKGFVTQISSQLLDQNRYDMVCTCGPEPMELIVASQADAAQVYCQVSLERMMACGVGACLGCVVRTSAGLQRVCVDGPIFDASEVIWQ